ncbi:unnamed protein product [Didymodactylos carnosus]|uniref:Uncharacterized protein n=1 Tax=Didymodactylos carnosus TaxID=1234261 RepID=A0A8S2DKW7_9BILA|nr:unnamed protein product [Didymodactylos carnosus]CAF3694972.1 unnamed protein product [Didymodactylos carnosus]
MTSETSNLAPDGGWGWIIVLCSFSIHFVIDGITYSMGSVYLEPMRKSLKRGTGAIGAIWSILPAVYLLVGLGFGLLYLPAIVSVNYYFEKKRSLAMGFAVSGAGCGTMVFPHLMPVIINRFGYEMGLLAESIILLFCVVFGLLMIPLPSEPSEVKRKQKKLKASNLTKITQIPVETATNNRGLPHAGGIFAGVVPSAYDPINLLPNSGSRSSLAFCYQKLLDKQWTALYFERIVANRLLLYILTLIIAGSATALEPLLALKFGHHLFLHITYAVIFGFSTGEYIGITSVVAVDLVGLEKFSDAFGLVLVVQGVAIAFGLPIVGVLNDELGSYLIPYVIVGVVITLSGVVLFLIPLIKRWQQSSATTNKSLTTSHEIDDMNTTSVNLT